MERLELNKELYYKELERKDSLNDGLSIPIGVITGQLALIDYLYSELGTPDLFSSITWESSLIVLDSLLVVISTVGLAISFYQPTIRRAPCRLESFYDYRFIDLPDVYEQFYQEELSENVNNMTPNPEQAANSILENLLLQHYVSATSHNTTLNDIKTERFAKAKLFLVLSVFISLFFVVGTFIMSEAEEDKPQKIEIVNPIIIEPMESQEFKNSDKPKEQPKQAPAPKAEPKPRTEPKIRVIPQIRVIPEGAEPPKGNPLND